MREPESAEPEALPAPTAARADSRAPIATNTGLRTNVAMAVSTVATVALGVLRTKCTVLFVDVPSVGRLGLLTVLLGLASALGGLGLGLSGVRALAVVRGGPEHARAQRALLRGTASLAGLAAVVVTVGMLVFGRVSPAHATSAFLVVVLGVTVAASVASVGYTAVLGSEGRATDVARVGGIGALVGLVTTVAVLPFGANAIIAANLLGPAAGTLLAAVLYARPLLRTESAAGPWVEPFSDMARVGAMLTSGVVLSSAVQYLARAIIERRIDLAAVGRFHAVTVLDQVYLGFLLSALGSEFLPRVTAASPDPERFNETVNDQLRLALLVATPAVVVLMVAAPVALRVAYSAEFLPVVGLLRWYLLAGIPKVLGWCFAFVLIARGSRWRYLSTDLAWQVAFMGLGVGLQRRMGLSAFGLGYCVAYVVYALANLAFVRRRTGLRFEPATRWSLIRGVGTVLAVAASLRFGRAGLGVALVLTALVLALAVEAVVARLRSGVEARREAP